MLLKSSELILNPNGSIYHLNLRPNQVANTIIFVGDPNRVEMVSKHFDSIEYRVQNREFITHTGVYKNKPISVISTGIGVDNIDIVLNELDALFNIDFKTLTPKTTLTRLQIIRIGTSGTIQKEIELDAFLVSTLAIDFTNMLHNYEIEKISELEFEHAFLTQLPSFKINPPVLRCSHLLLNTFQDAKLINGITATAGGFYAPQGRTLRLKPKHLNFIEALQAFNFKHQKISNIEMETAAIYGLAKLLGHEAISLNAILANRITGGFSKNPQQTIEQLITFTLHKITQL